MEVVVAAAIAAFVLWGLVALANRMVATAASLNARCSTAQAGADRLVERLASDATSAWSVSAPSAREIDFYGEDGSHRPFTWSYRFDATQQTVTRSSGEVFAVVGGFSAGNANVSDLANPAAIAYMTRCSPDRPLRARPRQPFVTLHLLGVGVERTESLASGAVPTSFTVVVRFTPSPTPLATATPTPLR